MSNLIFSLNATVPIFLTMLVGTFLKKIGLINDSFASCMDKLVFKVALPVMLFQNLSTVSFYECWDMKFVAFCFLVTVLGIAGTILISMVWKDRTIRGEFIQAAYRSSTALLGVAFISNIYGSSLMAPLMIVAAVPVYNMMAVVVLTVYGPVPEKMNREKVKRTIKGVVTNPIILGILIGCIWSLLQIPVPTILDKTLSNIAKLATPMGLLSMGASFKWNKVSEQWAPVLVSSVIKLLGMTLIFIPVAVFLGFRTEQLVAILIMLGSPTTVSAYPMVKSMGHKGNVTSGAVMLTTLFSAFTLTAWIYVLRTLGML